MTAYTRLWRRRFHADLRRPGVVRETAWGLAELVGIFAAFVAMCLLWPAAVTGPVVMAGGFMLAGIAAGGYKLRCAILAARPTTSGHSYRANGQYLHPIRGQDASRP